MGFKIRRINKTPKVPDSLRKNYIIMCKITIVIPVFKVGKYIENSMKSVCAQTFKDFEVLLVDNNTPDDSIEIAERVLIEGGIDYRVIKQTTQGLPAARNMGIREAKGEWIISIDPDDTVSPRFLVDLYECATSNGLDTVFSKYDEVGPEHLFDFPQEDLENVTELYEREDVLKLLLVRKLPLMVSNMFFNKESFVKKGCWFDEKVILGADLMNLWRILVNTKKIAYVNKYLYNHFERPDSLMTAPSWKKIDSNLSGYARLRVYITENHSETLADWIYARAVYGMISTLCVFGDKRTYREYLHKYYNKEIHTILQTFPDKKIKLLDSVLYWSPFVSYYINVALRRPDSLIWKILAKKLHNQ